MQSHRRRADGGASWCTVAALLLTLCLMNESGSAIPFEEFVGHPFNESNGYSVFPRILDLVRGLPIPVLFPYFGRTFSYVHIEDSGYVSLINVNDSVNIRDIATLLAGTPYEPQDFPLNTSNTILFGIDWGAVVAAYWYDADTRGIRSGRIYYKDVTRGSDPDLTEVIDTLATPYLCGFNTIWALIVTWDHVGYYSQRSDKLNTFQLVLATDGRRSIAVFNYAEDGINWAGEAVAGYNVGDENGHFKLPGSFSEDIQHIDNTTGNTGKEGQWVLVLDDNPPCSSGMTLTPTFGSIYGGTPVTVTLPDQENYLLTTNDIMIDILCTFDQVQTRGMAVSANVALCVSPAMTKLGFVPFQFKISLGEESIFADNSRFLAISGQRSHEIDVIKVASDDRQLLIFTPGEDEGTLETVSVKWPIHFVDAEFMKPEDYTVDIHLYELDIKSFTLSDPQNPFLLKENIINSGHYTGKIDTSMLTLRSDFSTHMVVFQVSVNPSTFSTGIPRIGKWSGAYVYYTKTIADLDAECSEWYSNEPENIGSRLLETATPCPSTRMQADIPSSGLLEVDISSFLGSTSYHIQHLQFYHPGATTCYEQLTRTVGSSQECCYDSDGNLHTNSPGGGSVDRFGSSTMDSRSDHILFDLFPYVHCCKGELRRCTSYYEVRPSDLGRNFFPPIPGWWFGDPHIVTLDGHKYTFNGKGDYVVLDTSDNSFTLHGRMEEAMNVDGSPASGGTVFTALAAQQSDSDTVQFELHEKLYPKINGVLDTFNDLNEKTFANVTIQRVGNDSFSAAFSSGIYIEVRAVTESGLAPYISNVILSMPASYRGQTRGLMGNYNGKPVDDLAPRHGGDPLPLNSTLSTLHWNFGVTWIISNASQSLFMYDEDSFEEFFDASFTPAFEPVFDDPAVEYLANEMCGGDVFCLFDIAATGDIDIGLETLMSGQEFVVIGNVSQPFTCTPSCVNGACIDGNVCACSAGYNGDRCDQPVTTACASNPCKNGGTCSQLAGTYTCTCQNGYTGSICQNGTAMDSSDTTVIFGTVGGLVGLLFLIMVSAVILGVCIKLCICHKKQKYTATDYDVVEMVSMQENPAYEDVHVSKKNYYSPNMSVI